jgi:hypothetical protein
MALLAGTTSSLGTLKAIVDQVSAKKSKFTKFELFMPRECCLTLLSLASTLETT